MIMEPSANRRRFSQFWRVIILLARTHSRLVEGCATTAPSGGRLSTVAIFGTSIRAGLVNSRPGRAAPRQFSNAAPWRHHRKPAPVPIPTSNCCIARDPNTPSSSASIACNVCCRIGHSKTVIGRQLAHSPSIHLVPSSINPANAALYAWLRCIDQQDQH